jgi:hypothetical protein
MKVFTKLGSALLVMLFTCSFVFAQNSNSVQNNLLHYYKQTGQDVMAQKLLDNASVQTKYTATKLDIKGTTAYAFVAYDPSSVNPIGPAYFDTDVPGAITSLGPNGAGDFIAGGSWAEGVWYGEEYGTGALYSIDPSSGAMTYIGSGSAAGGFNAIAYDVTTLTMFGCDYNGSSCGLYSIDLTSGANTYIGDVGLGALVIGLACDATGNLYAADLFTDVLISVDKATGAGTVIGPLGIDINYAQDLEFDNANGILYLAGYTSTGQLYTVDPATGSATYVGDFQGGAEMCGLAFEYSSVQYTNDIGIQTILSPTSGVNLGNEVVTVRIKNFGTAAQSNFNISYTLDGGTPVNATITNSIAGGATYDYTFPGTVDLSEYDTYNFVACTYLAGDENAVNDCKSKNITNGPPVYCDATTSTFDEYISNVLCGSINNSSSWQGGVADYTAMFTTIAAGASEAITVTNPVPYASDMVTCWVDWNMDYTFGTGEEQFVLTNVGGTGSSFTGSITVPAGTPNGDYRMRVRMTYSTAPTPCGPSTYGEVEDYTINVGGMGGDYVFFHDFENYTAGQQVACEYPLEWTTWSNAPCGTEDAYISADYAYSGVNSAVIAQNNDLVKDYGDLLTTGKYSIRFYAYIPTGKAGYFNTLQSFAGASSVWGLEVYFNAGGAGSVNANGTGTATFTWAPDVWFLVEHIVDMDNDNSEIWIDGNMIYSYQWSLGATGTGQNTLDANDFFGATANDQMYIDDYLMEEMTPPPPPPPPTNLTGPASVTAGDPIELVWTAPGGGGNGEWIEWDAAVNNGNGIGLTAGGTFYTASHWLPSDLTPYNGQYLSKINFFPLGDPAATFNLYVWTGANAGTQVMSQAIGSYTVDTWNEITLSSPVMINASQEFWFGYSVTHGGGTFPAGTDDGPAVGGKGDMISLDGTSWAAMGSTYGLDYNWNLAGYVAPSKGSVAPVKPMVKAFTGIPSVGSFASAKENGAGGNFSIKFNPSGSKALVGYNVYRKNPGSTTFNVIGYTSETNYTDNVTITGLYQYNVTAVYENPNGESDPTNTITVDVITGIEDVIYNSTSIYPNPASAVVNIKSEYSIVKVKVYNYAGQVIASELADSKFYQFNTSKFTPGLYMFQIETNEGTITKRIIIE